MVCIYCGSATSVINSRHQLRSNTIWRRRTCKECGATVTTTECMDLATAILVVHNLAHEPFSRDRLFVSIYESCKHRKDAQNSATILTDTVIRALYPHIYDALIEKSEIIKTTTKILKRFDEAAGVQYAAYHPI